jgi:sensor domain CHASE-containing protein
MGVFLDPLEISRLSDIYNGPIAVYRIQDSGMPSDFRAALESLSKAVPIVTRPLNQERVAGYALLDDIYGEPALILRIDEHRDFYAESRSTMLYLALSLLAGGLTASLLAGVRRPESCLCDGIIE